MRDLWKSLGPLAHRFNPPALKELPLVCVVVEYHGKPFNMEDFKGWEGESIADMHFSDWGDLPTLLKALGSCLSSTEYCERATGISSVTGNPPCTIVQIVLKEGGDVLHVLNINSSGYKDLTDGELRALRQLVQHSWGQIDYEYSRLSPEERAGLTRDLFEQLTAWAKPNAYELKARASPRPAARRKTPSSAPPRKRPARAGRKSSRGAK